MTENTQTTAERIATLINEGIDCSCDGGWTNESLLGVLSVAQTIAAEIDRLTAERDVARAHNAELSTELAGANFEGNLAMIQRDEAYVVLKKRTAERDAARAQLQEARDKLIEVRDTLHHTNNEFAVILRERNEARAEVERLRPAAEAWELLEHMYHNTGSSLAASYTKACIDKAARARAAAVHIVRGVDDALRTLGAI